MAEWYISSVEYAARAVWTAATAVTVGTLRRPTAPSSGNERTYRVSAIAGTGTTGGSEPSWPLTAGSTVVDNAGANQVTWTEVSGNSAYAPQSAAAHVEVIWTQTSGRSTTNGDDWTFVDSAHVEPVWSSGRDWTRASKVRVVTWAGMSIPPIPADMAAGPVVLSCTGSYLTLAGTADFDGFEFRVGSGASTASLYIGRAALPGVVNIRNGKIKLNNTSASSRIELGDSSGGSLWLDNTPVEFGAAGQGIKFAIVNAYFVWTNTANAVQGTPPTTLFTNTTPYNWVLVENCDLSAVSGTIVTVGTGSLTFAGTFRVARCKLHNSVTKTNNWKLRSPADALEFVACGGSTINKMSTVHKATMSGEISTTYNEYRDSAIADADGSKFSLKAVQTTAANGSPSRALHNIIALPEKWNATTGSAITATVQVAVEHTALLSAANLWLEAIYLGDSGSPLASSVSGVAKDAPGGTPTAGTASTENWTAVGRTDSENPASGTIRSVSSNAGRLFVKQSGGAFNGSLPSGYATMVDGDTITDGAASVAALFRQRVAVAFTPQRAGPIGFRLHCYHPAATPKILLVDPTVVLS